MSRTWHLRQAHAARRAAKRFAGSADLQRTLTFYYWMGKEEAHMETCTAIDRSAKRLTRRKKAA